MRGCRAARIRCGALAGESQVGDHPLVEMPNLLPIVGRRCSGSAGAYLLRALTESGSIPPQPGSLPVSPMRCLARLGGAAVQRRSVEGRGREFDRVLVLSPLVWEATARFHVIGVGRGRRPVGLCGFRDGDFLAEGPADRIQLCNAGGLGNGRGAANATHDVLPFTFLFLAVAAAIETSACLDHWLSERWLGAIAADLAVLFGYLPGDQRTRFAPRL